MGFFTNLLTEKFIDAPNRRRREEIFAEALGQPATRVGEFTGMEITYDEAGNPIPKDVTYRTETDATGLLADIYNPKNQTRFARKMMGAPGGQAIANSMMTQVQQGGQVLDRMDYENAREDAIFNQVRQSLFATPQTRPQTTIPATGGRQPRIPNISPIAPTSQVPGTTGRVETSPGISPDVRPTGTAEDFEKYSALRRQVESFAMHPAMKDSIKPILDSLDATWGYGPGATNAMREWRAAQRFNGYDGTFEDWKKMNRQTIMKGDPAKVTDLQKLMFPPGSPGYNKYGTSSIPYGIAPEELASLGAVLRDDLSAEGAGKYTMLKTAQEQFPIIQKTVFSAPGVFDTKTLWEMVALDFTDLASFGVSSNAQQAYAAFETGMQGITRTETGAAMRDEEIDNTKRRFMPKPWSSNEANMLRWNAFQYFINNATDIINPAAKENQGLKPAEIMDKAVTKTLEQFGVKDETNPPKELKPLFDKAKQEKITYTGHDDQYIYGLDSNGRKARVPR